MRSVRVVLFVVASMFGIFRIQESKQLFARSLDTECQRATTCPTEFVGRDSRLNSYEDIRNANCFCDDLCSSYGDCCKGYVRPLDLELPVHQIKPEAVSCHRNYEVSGRSFLDIYIVDSCPKNYDNAYVRAECGSQSDTFHKLPVDGKRSKVLFRNIYCALCNGESDVMFWKVETVCQDYERRGDLRTAYVNNSKCDHEVVRLDDSRIRLCKPAVKKCADDWTNQTVMDECLNENNTAYVYRKWSEDEQTVYRNRQCAICNHIRENELSCLDRKSSQDEGEGGLPGLRPQYSFLFDLNHGSGNIVDNRVF